MGELDCIGAVHSAEREARPIPHHVGGDALKASEADAADYGRINKVKCTIMAKKKGTARRKVQEVQMDDTAEREAILDERQTLKRLFPPQYSPDIGVFNDGKVEVMFKLSYAQAEGLAHLLKEHKL